jgi:hypothetical protein
MMQVEWKRRDDPDRNGVGQKRPPRHRQVGEQEKKSADETGAKLQICIYVCVLASEYVST